MSGDWRVIAASAVGSAHADGLNQDAYAHRVLPPGSVVAAVADGHGGRHYVRSASGARFAVDIAVAVAAEHLPTPVPAASAADPGGARPDLRRACRDIVRRWRAAIAADVAARPFTRAEHERAGRDLNLQPTLAYGTTLLIAVVVDGRADLAQLGDGDVLVVSAGRQVPEPVPGDRRLGGGMTTSLGSDGAEDDFRFGAVDPVELVMLASDGYGNAFADPQWQAVVVDDLRRALAAHGLGAVHREFEGWLAESARAGGDDVTAVVLVDTSGIGAAPPPPAVTRDLRPTAAPAATAVGAATVLGAPAGGSRTGGQAATVLTGPPPVLTGPPPVLTGPPPVPTVAAAVPPAGRATAVPPRRSRTGPWIAGIAGALLVGGVVGFTLARGPLAPAPIVERVVEQTPVTVSGPPVTVPTTVATTIPTTVPTTLTQTVTSSETASPFGTATTTVSDPATATGAPTTDTEIVPPAQNPPEGSTEP